jgi:S-adenosylmethionine:tRNA ribosyltransferase-isomerase
VDAGEPIDLSATEAYRYDLPAELIAKVPAEPRDAARLLHLPAGGGLSDRSFRDLPELLRAGDVLIVNETRVIKARLIGTREPGGGAAEIFLLRPSDRERYDPGARTFAALVRPGRRLRAGARVRFGDLAVAEILTVAVDGVRTVRFDAAGSFDEVLEGFGRMPLPPYVGAGDAARDARYQTVFGRVPGSVAAPTASLHFTDETFARLRERGVQVVPLILDVGLGTFKPIEAESIAAHRMHFEHYEIPEATAAAIESARREGRRVIAAGTTVLRALESAAAREDPSAPAENRPRIRSGPAETDIFIRPGYRFRVADALLTNFHLPASTLFVLVCAFAGYERMRAAYAHAIAERYRFYSFGDAMLIERPSTTSR